MSNKNWHNLIKYTLKTHSINLYDVFKLLNKILFIYFFQPEIYKVQNNQLSYFPNLITTILKLFSRNKANILICILRIK